MGLYQVNVNEATNQLAELVEAAIRGEIVLITKNGEDTVQLVPVPSKQPRPKFGSAKGKIHLSADFDAPLEDFHPYTK
jgi:prevent-host-death family protein